MQAVKTPVSHLLDEASHPILLVQLSPNGEVVPGDDFRQEAVDGVPLLYSGDELLSLLVVPQ